MLGISATADLTKRKFQVAPGLLVRSWGEESVVVFLPSTRNTHLIDRTTGLLLQALLAAPSACDVSVLWARLDVDVDSERGFEPPSADDLSALELRLETLVQSGMVVSPSPDSTALKC